MPSDFFELGLDNKVFKCNAFITAGILYSLGSSRLRYCDFRLSGMGIGILGGIIKMKVQQIVLRGSNVFGATQLC